MINDENICALCNNKVGKYKINEKYICSQCKETIIKKAVDTEDYYKLLIKSNNSTNSLLNLFILMIILFILTNFFREINNNSFLISIWGFTLLIAILITIYTCKKKYK